MKHADLWGHAALRLCEICSAQECYRLPTSQLRVARLKDHSRITISGRNSNSTSSLFQSVETINRRWKYHRRVWSYKVCCERETDCGTFSLPVVSETSPSQPRQWWWWGVKMDASWDDMDDNDQLSVLRRWRGGGGLNHRGAALRAVREQREGTFILWQLKKALIHRESVCVCVLHLLIEYKHFHKECKYNAAEKQPFNFSNGGWLLIIFLFLRVANKRTTQTDHTMVVQNGCQVHLQQRQ